MKTVHPRRGEIWWADLRIPRGSEPGYIRPVLIVQSDLFNQSSLRTVVVIVLTSNVRLADAPGNVLLSRKATGLPKASVANVSQVLTIDRQYLERKAGQLSQNELHEIDRGLRLSLAL